VSFYRETIIKKTRKKHQCGFCGREIPEGKGCIENAGTFEGNFFHGHLCLPCRRDMKGIDLSEGYSPGDYYEYDENMEECPKCKYYERPILDEENKEYVLFECGDCGHEWKKFRGWE
jgi:hypothetical protein